METLEVRRLLLYLTISLFVCSSVIGCCEKKPTVDVARIMRENEAKRAALAAKYDKKLKELMENYDRQQKASLTTMCGYVCVSPWSQWTSCSKPCGGGTQNRTRSHRTIGECSTLKNFVCPQKELSQTKRCNPGCPYGGTPTSSACSCTPSRTGNCCQNPVICPYIRRPRHAIMDGRWPAVYGNVISFTCYDGYHLRGPETMRCSGEGSPDTPPGEGSWNPDTPPTCSKITCLKPVETSNLKNLNSKSIYDYGEDIYYGCPPGYALKGPRSVRCIKYSGTTGRWNNAPPICESKSCGKPGVPVNGGMSGTSYLYGDEVTFYCNPGYQFLGHQTIICMVSERWYGTTPQCIEIKCEAPHAPKFGAVGLGAGTNFGSTVVFSCDEGYILEGSSVTSCTDDGSWNTTVPTCRAATCREPAVPDHGSKDGSQYFFPHSVKFSCYSGYTLQGAESISCLANGTWKGEFPTCQPCEKNFYMDRVETGNCQKCPNNTYTLSVGSTSRRHCLCQKGYHGPPGGPCTVIQCEELSAPENGQMANCSQIFKGKCHFDCDQGYIIDKGSPVRLCGSLGEWSGTQPHCSACPQNYYKLGSKSCHQCPSNSRTEKEASIKTDCICEEGYSGPPGGPCDDVNECETNSPCEDKCDNLVGGFLCSCSRPGYKLDEDDRSCKVVKQCKNLTTDDAPGNGGLVCHWYYEQNSQQCTVKCNNGYMFPSRINNYETCGATTGFTWTFQSQDPYARIPSCIEEYFPGMRLEADANFFTTNCGDISEEEKIEVFNNFKKQLDKNKVCELRGTKVCNIKDMGIICGRRVRRHVPGVGMQDVNEFDMQFNVSSIMKWKDPRKDCDKICPFLKIPAKECAPDLCNSAYKRYLRIALMYVKRHLAFLFQNARKRQKLEFSAAGRTFSPGSRIRQGDVLVECPIGMVADASKEFCVPCEPGTFYNSTGLCEACPVGTFQPLQNKTVCLDCPYGTTTNFTGSLLCEICDDGYFGKQCKEVCRCQNGTCDPIDGSCRCHQGWEGTYCDQDVDGCRDVTCYPGVSCIDVPAPDTGFDCGSCPPGFVGDGSNCERDEL